MRTRAVVEIACEMDPLDREELIGLAYRFSHAGLVVLALRGIERQAVDRILNPIVESVGRDVAGTLYVDALDPAVLLSFVTAETVVVGLTDRFCSDLSAQGVRVFRTFDGLMPSAESVEHRTSEIEK